MFLCKSPITTFPSLWPREENEKKFNQNFGNFYHSEAVRNYENLQYIWITRKTASPMPSNVQFQYCSHYFTWQGFMQLTIFLAAVFWSSSHPPSCNLSISSDSFLPLRISFCSIMVHKCSVSSSLRSSLSNRSSLASRNSCSALSYRFLQYKTAYVFLSAGSVTHRTKFG